MSPAKLYSVRATRLKELGFKTYEDYLRSDLWRARRERYSQKYEPACHWCGNPVVQLHHQHYARLGCEQDKDLRWYCERHHEQWHRSGGYLAGATYNQINVIVNRGLRSRDDASDLTFWDAFEVIAA